MPERILNGKGYIQKSIPERIQERMPERILYNGKAYKNAYQKRYMRDARGYCIMGRIQKSIPQRIQERMPERIP